MGRISPGRFVGWNVGCVLGVSYFWWLFWLTGHNSTPPIVRLFAAGFLGYMSVCCAAYIAPTPSKAVPAMMMAMLVCLLSGIGIFACVVEKEWFGIAQSMVGVVAAAISMHGQSQNSK